MVNGNVATRARSNLRRARAIRRRNVNVAAARNRRLVRRARATFNPERAASSMGQGIGTALDNAGRGL